MNPTLKKRLLRFTTACAVVALTGWLTRDFWFRQVRIYSYGLAEVYADEYGYSMPEVDEIEVIGFDGVDPRGSGGLGSISHYQIIGKVALHGDDAKTVAELWRSLPRGRVFSAMCHNPGYALRFKRGGKTIFETTVCWKCNNYSMPMGIFGSMVYGFDASTKPAISLLEILKKQVPPHIHPKG